MLMWPPCGNQREGVLRVSGSFSIELVSVMESQSVRAEGMLRGDLDEMNASQFDDRETEPKQRELTRVSLAVEPGHGPLQAGGTVVILRLDLCHSALPCGTQGFLLSIVAAAHFLARGGRLVFQSAHHVSFRS